MVKKTAVILLCYFHNTGCMWNVMGNALNTCHRLCKNNAKLAGKPVLSIVIEKIELINYLRVPNKKQYSWLAKRLAAQHGNFILVLYRSVK